MPPPPRKQENLIVNLACNILLPTLVLSKLSTPDRLGPVYGLVVALLFPLGYGLWDFLKRRETNFISLIGFASVLLTGGFGLMKLETEIFAIKEAAVPAVIGLVVAFSNFTRRPLIQTFIYNPQVIDVPRVDAELAARGHQAAFGDLMRKAGWLVVGSFAVSAVLNYALARYVLVSPSGTPEFNAELGKMNLLSWPVIALPSTGMMVIALWQLLSGVKKLTGLGLEDIVHQPPPKEVKPKV